MWTDGPQDPQHQTPNGVVMGLEAVGRFGSRSEFEMNVSNRDFLELCRNGQRQQEEH